MLKINIKNIIYYLLVFFAFLLPSEATLSSTFNIPGFFKLYYIFTFIGAFLVYLYPKKFLKKISIDKTFMILFLIFIIWIFIGDIVNLLQFNMLIHHYKRTAGSAFFNDQNGFIMIGFVRTIIVLLYITILFLFTKTEKCRKGIIKGFFILGIITSVYSIYQFVGYFCHFPFTSVFLLGGADGRPDGALNFGLRRVEGLFYEPGPQATFLAPITIFLFFLILSKSSKFKILKNKMLSIPLFLLFLVISFLTLSPITFGSILLAFLFYFIFNYKEFLKGKVLKYFIMGIVSLAVFFTVFLTIFINKLGNFDISECDKCLFFKNDRRYFYIKQ